MKIKDGFILKEVAGNNIVIACGEQKMTFNGVMTFNEVGAAVFKLLDGTNTAENIAEKIAADYNADIETVKKDVNTLIEKMKRYGLVEE